MSQIVHYDRILRTPALHLAVKCWDELLHRGFIDPAAIAIAWDHRVVAMHDSLSKVQGEPPGDIMGILTWSDVEWSDSIHINLAYVLPKFRGRNIHTQLFVALVGKARELKRSCITSSVHQDNTTAIASMNGMGRYTSGLYTRYEVAQR